METAGRGASIHLEGRYGPIAAKKICVLGGNGNNGGDGFVVARVLYSRGASVQVLALGTTDAMSSEAAHNWRLLEKLAARDASGRLKLDRHSVTEQALPPADIYVDALLGTGLTRPLRAPISQMVASLNERKAPTVALDMPTGLHPDTGAILGGATRADLTVTMGARKPGLLLGDGPAVAGHIEVIDIGIPPFILNETKTWLTSDAGVGSWLPQRSPLAHKYSVGMALVVGGSPGLTGAPVMASEAAARIGAGYVTCATGRSSQPVLATKMTEIATAALPEGPQGLDGADALAALAPHLCRAKALLIGPGLGKGAGTQSFVRDLLASLSIPAVVDADGLNALSHMTDRIAALSQGRWILTPHTGEFARLAGLGVDLADRVALARQYAQHWNCVLILKGLPSVVGTPAGMVYISGAGNNALATAGTGDILAGLCVGLLAQGLAPAEAAACALHLGGAAADRYAAQFATETMVAMDLLGELPHVLRERWSAKPC